MINLPFHGSHQARCHLLFKFWDEQSDSFSWKFITLSASQCLLLSFYISSSKCSHKSSEKRNYKKMISFNKLDLTWQYVMKVSYCESGDSFPVNKLLLWKHHCALFTSNPAIWSCTCASSFPSLHRKDWLLPLLSLNRCVGNLKTDSSHPGPKNKALQLRGAIILRQFHRKANPWLHRSPCLGRLPKRRRAFYS